MPTPAPTITALPTPPNRDDSVNFAARADAFVGALPTFGTEANALATNVYNNAVEAEADAVAAAASAAGSASSAAAANASAQAAAISSNVTLWVSGTSYTSGQTVYSPITFLTYRRITNGAGTTDPSADGTNWQLISGTVSSIAISGGTTGLTVSGSPVTTSGTITLAGTLAVANGGTGATTLTAKNLVVGNGTSAVTFIAPGSSGTVLTSNGTDWVAQAPGGGLPDVDIVTGTTQTAVKGKHYILTNVAATTVTLPSSPSAGDTVFVTVGNGLVTNVVARNGKNIQSLAEDVTLDSKYASVQLRYVDATRGWIFA